MEERRFVLVRVGLRRVVKPYVRREIELPADPAALFSIVPRAIFLDLGIQPLERVDFELADGTVVQREVGEARFDYEGHQGISKVILGEVLEGARLGLLTLESLGLEVDWPRRRLRPMRLIMYSSRPAA